MAAHKSRSRAFFAKIAQPLFELPCEGDPRDAPRSLPEQNMRRARALKLPSGQDVAYEMDLEPLTNEELGVADIDGLGGKAPLWYYILRESGHEVGAGGAHLGPVGGRLVAETIVGMITARELNVWTPTLPNRAGEAGDFTMADLVAFRAVVD